MTFTPYNTTIARTKTTKPVCDGIMNAPAASHIGGLVSRHHETSDLDKDSYNFVGVCVHIHSIANVLLKKSTYLRILGSGVPCLDDEALEPGQQYQ